MFFYAKHVQHHVRCGFLLPHLWLHAACCSIGTPRTTIDAQPPNTVQGNQLMVLGERGTYSCLPCRNAALFNSERHYLKRAHSLECDALLHQIKNQPIKIASYSANSCPSRLISNNRKCPVTRAPIYLSQSFRRKPSSLLAPLDTRKTLLS